MGAVWGVAERASEACKRIRFPRSSCLLDSASKATKFLPELRRKIPQSPFHSRCARQELEPSHTTGLIITLSFLWFELAQGCSPWLHINGLSGLKICLCSIRRSRLQTSNWLDWPLRNKPIFHKSVSQKLTCKITQNFFLKTNKQKNSPS